MLSASWYTEPSFLEAERAAVFQKSWYFLGHRSKFVGHDGPVRYEFAGVELEAEAVRDGTVASQEPAVRVWPVDPTVSIKTYITKHGLVFSTISPDAPPWEEYFDGLEKLLDKADFTPLVHRRSLIYEGRFNWKTMMDGFQECLHCTFAHPGFSAKYRLNSYGVTCYGNYSQHVTDPDAADDDGLFLHLFPTCSLNLYNGGMSSFRVCPTNDPGVTRMEFDYYHYATGQEFEEYYAFVREVADEDTALCENVQKNLSTLAYKEGTLHPCEESGVISYHNQLRELVGAHFA